MPQWLPRLTLPEIGVVLLTIGLCMTASRIGAVGDLLARLFGAGRGADKQNSD
jgi:hypothetical protein